MKEYGGVTIAAEGKWGDTWMSKTILHKSKRSAWEEDVVVWGRKMF